MNFSKLMASMEPNVPQACRLKLTPLRAAVASITADSIPAW